MKQITVAEALRWSDKHRKLSDNEGVRVVHIQQLLQQELNSLAQEVEELKLSGDKLRSDDKSLLKRKLDGIKSYNNAIDQVSQLIRERGNRE